MQFYHDTICKMCTRDAPCVNTHRTDFAGQSHGNKCFNIIGKQYTKNGLTLKLRSDAENLEDLATQLMKVQRSNFFLNEYPEECGHLQYFDIDAPISDVLLGEIIRSLTGLTTGAEVKVLRNTISGKVHLIMNVAAHTFRANLRKRAIAVTISKYIYEKTSASTYSKDEWAAIFDGKAAGIRSALSVKMSGGIVAQGKGVYAPIGCNPDSLSAAEAVAIVCENSIYRPAAAEWTREVLDEFERVEAELELNVKTAKKYDLVSAYDTAARTIPFLGEPRDVSAALINEFVSVLPASLAGGPWKRTMMHVKTASLLVIGFDPTYFLHEWSKQSPLYDMAGNDAQYENYHEIPRDAGVSLTWLRNRAEQFLRPDPNLFRGDLGFAEIFVSLAGDRIKVVSKDKSCYIWDQKSALWMRCEKEWIGNEVSRELEKVIGEYINRLRLLKVTDVSKSIKRWQGSAQHVCNTVPSMNIVNKTIPMLYDANFLSKLNNQPDLLPIRGNSVVNLQTGEVLAREFAHNFTFECPVAVDRDLGRRALVEQFMLDICCGDVALLRYMQVALGYCITGQVNEKAIFIWYGPKGCNGKSTVMNIIKAILGNYCKSSSKCLFIKSGDDSKLNSEREVLKDARAVMFSETAIGDVLNDDVLKMASGDDVIRVNPKHRDEYEFRSQAKLLIASNHKPDINVSDDAMVKRVKFMPFMAKFVTNPTAPYERLINKPLAKRMENDLLDAFFTWVLDGAVEWYANGLAVAPVVMMQATAEYIGENDEIGQFLDDETEPAIGSYILLKDLYAKYCDWCRSRNAKMKGTRIFAADMEKKYKKEKKNTGIVFIGLAVKETYDDMKI